MCTTDLRKKEGEDWHRCHFHREGNGIVMGVSHKEKPGQLKNKTHCSGIRDFIVTSVAN